MFNFAKKPAKSTLNRKLIVNQLEAREVPAAYLWTGATSNLWSDNTNWSVSGAVPADSPSTADDVTINSGSTCNFDPPVSNIAINSLTMNGNAILDLGYATGGKSLIVDGNTTSRIGDATPGTAVATIKANTPATGGGYGSGGLKFYGNQTVDVNKASFQFYGVGVGFANSIFFSNSAVNFNTSVYAEANMFFGFTTGSNWTTAKFNMGSGNNFDLASYGQINNQSKGQVLLQSGNVAQSGSNTNSFENLGIVQNSSSSDFKVKKLHNDLGGRLHLIGGGKLVGQVTSENASKTYIWAGSGIDNDGGSSLFKSGSVTQFLSDSVTPPSGIGMKGNFTFASGSTQGYHAYTMTKPSSTNPQSWTYGTFNGTGTSTQVSLSKDSANNASWSASGTTNMEIFYDIYGTGACYFASLGSSVSGSLSISGTLNLDTQGIIPSTGKVSLFYTNGTQSISFGTINQTGATWLNTFSTSTPFYSTWGVKNY